MKLTSMTLIVPALVLTFLCASLLVPAPPAQAANLACSAAPAAGPAGTTFHLTAGGFTPKVHVWLYAVEPDGTAFSDPVNQGFGGGAQADESGTVTFPFLTRFEEVGKTVARALGTWTLVVQELGPGGTTVHEAHCVVQLTASGETLSGGSLQVTPARGFSDDVFTVSGAGFMPQEPVSLWLTPPSNCSGFGFILDGVLYTNSAANAVAFDSVTADAAGAFSDAILTSTPYFCTGTWGVSVRGGRSGRGGMGTFQVVGHAVTLGSASLTVTPAVALSRGGVLTFEGSGFTPHEGINCWYTRPEGTVREFHLFPADSAGAFNFVWRTGLDDGSGQYIEGSLGTYLMSCKGQASHQIALTQFSLMGGLSDP